MNNSDPKSLISYMIDISLLYIINIEKAVLYLKKYIVNLQELILQYEHFSSTKLSRFYMRMYCSSLIYDDNDIEYKPFFNKNTKEYESIYLDYILPKYFVIYKNGKKFISSSENFELTSKTIILKDHDNNIGLFQIKPNYFRFKYPKDYLDKNFYKKFDLIKILVDLDVPIQNQTILEIPRVQAIQILLQLKCNIYLHNLDVIYINKILTWNSIIGMTKLKLFKILIKHLESVGLFEYLYDFDK